MALFRQLWSRIRNVPLFRRFSYPLRPKLPVPPIQLPADDEGKPRIRAPHEYALDFGTGNIALAVVERTGAPTFLDLTPPGTTPDPDIDPRLCDSTVYRSRALDRPWLTENYAVGFDIQKQQGSTYRSFPSIKRLIEAEARHPKSEAWQAAVVRDVAAVTARLFREARLPGPGPERPRPVENGDAANVRVYVTVPNAFPQDAVTVVVTGVRFGVAAALELNGFPDVKVLSEAEAVAWSRWEMLKGEEDARVLIVDAGAGTTDFSIVRRVKEEPASPIQMIVSAGLPVGGIDLDLFLAARDAPDPGPPGAAPPGGQGPRTDVLPRARAHKQRHLSEGSAPGAAPDDSYAAGFAVTKEETDALLERYLSFAIDALVDALPAAERGKLRRVFVSGGASLTRGFVERLRSSVAHAVGRNVPVDPVGRTAVDRKLAVLRGVAAYAQHTFARDPTITRAGSTIFVAPRGISSDGPYPLILPGDPLKEGRALVAWRVPLSTELRCALDFTDHFIPEETLRRIGERVLPTDQHRDGLEPWATVYLGGVEDVPTEHFGQLVFDFATRRAQCRIDGEANSLRPPARMTPLVHPVSLEREAWYSL
ncbi:hypothetical protein [Longimicrobium sp.]|uniref:hypothetical protein n=1 Tax=Longimicrobium sp. TaxID=2029185 RepID=UPI003B3AEB6D